MQECSTDFVRRFAMLFFLPFTFHTVVFLVIQAPLHTAILSLFAGSYSPSIDCLPADFDCRLPKCRGRLKVKYTVL